MKKKISFSRFPAKMNESDIRIMAEALVLLYRDLQLEVFDDWCGYKGTDDNGRDFFYAYSDTVPVPQELASDAKLINVALFLANKYMEEFEHDEDC